MSLRRRGKRRRPWFIIIPVLLLALLIGGLIFFSYAQFRPNPKFPIPCLTSEGSYLHIHPYLRIVIDGQNVTVPSAIGIQNPLFQGSSDIAVSGSCLEPVHTHDASGVLHIESPTNTNYSLGLFFQIWAATYPTVPFEGANRPVVFNSTDILGFKADATHHIVLLVDGSASAAGSALILDSLDYCSSAVQNVTPCYPTAGGNPEWNGGSNYPFGPGHTIVIKYTTTG